MKQTKVLFLTRRFEPHTGGVETHLQHLNNELKKRKFKITVITEQHSLAVPLVESIRGIEVLRIPLPHQQTSKLAIWHWMLSNISLFTSFDIIHIHDVFFWILPIYLLLKLKRKKIYITFHGYEGDKNPNIKQKFWHRLANLLCSGSICIGEFHSKWYGVRPNDVSFGAVKDISPKNNYKNINSVIKIVFVGRLAEDTGILAYLAAIKVLMKRKHVTLDVFGDGSLNSIVKQFAKEHALPVRFHGFVPQTSIMLSEYDIAFVSQYLAILECLAAGLPVISYYDTEIKQDYLLISPFGKWLTVAKSTKEIAESVELVQRINSKKKIKIAQDWAASQTWQKLTSKYLRLWGLSKKTN